MDIRIMTIILKDGMPSLTFEFTSWVLKDGCLFVRNTTVDDETSVFPLSSIVCFTDKLKKGE